MFYHGSSLPQADIEVELVDADDESRASSLEQELDEASHSDASVEL